MYQRLGVLRFQVQGFAIVGQSLLRIAFGVAEQPQPVVNLRRRRELAQVALAFGTGLLAGTGVGKPGNAGQQLSCILAFVLARRCWLGGKGEHPQWARQRCAR